MLEEIKSHKLVLGLVAVWLVIFLFVLSFLEANRYTDRLEAEGILVLSITVGSALGYIGLAELIVGLQFGRSDRPSTKGAPAAREKARSAAVRSPGRIWRLRFSGFLSMLVRCPLTNSRIDRLLEAVTVGGAGKADRRTISLYLPRRGNPVTKQLPCFEP